MCLRREWVALSVAAMGLTLGIAPTEVEAQTQVEARSEAKAAQARAASAVSLAKAIQAEFASDLAKLAANLKDGADRAGKAAEAAAEAAVLSAGASVVAADGAVVSAPGSIENALAAVHSAEAATHRAEAAGQEARSACHKTLAAAPGDLKAAADHLATAAASAKQAADHQLQALLHDVQTAAHNQRAADLGASRDRSNLQAEAQNRQAEAQRALAAFLNAGVPVVTLPPAPVPGKYFQLDGKTLPVALTIHYNLRRIPVEFIVDNGTPDDPSKLVILPRTLLPSGPARINVSLSFTHQKSGPLTIPKSPLRINLDGGKYTLGSDELNAIARDFIVTMNEIDRTFSTANPIDVKDVTISITGDGVSDTIRGSLRIVPALVNTRD